MFQSHVVDKQKMMILIFSVFSFLFGLYWFREAADSRSVVIIFNDNDENSQSINVDKQDVINSFWPNLII